MNKSILISLITGFIFLSFIVKAQKPASFVKGKIYFKLKDNVKIELSKSSNDNVKPADLPFLAKLSSKYKISKTRRPFVIDEDPKLLRSFELNFENYSLVDSLINEIEAFDMIEYAEKVPIAELCYTPNDSYFKNINNLHLKWHWDVIQAEDAWDICKGDPDIKVAVVDVAVWTAHPDLNSKVVAQYDATNGAPDCNPPSISNNQSKYELWSHGTHCAGLIGAATNNETGVAGIGYNVSIIGVKAADSQSAQLTSYLDAVTWAANNGANVISMSYGKSGSQTGQNIYYAAYKKGITLVAAAGNQGDDAINYPASYSFIISVGSTDSDDIKSSFSQYNEYVDIMAPGGYCMGYSPTISLLSTTYNTYLSGVGNITGNYDFMIGTSMATPIVSGLCGLMLSLDPSLTPLEIEQCLKSTAINIDTLEVNDGSNKPYSGKMGAGRINAYKAMLCAGSKLPLKANFKAGQTEIKSGTAINFTNLSLGAPDKYKWTFPGAKPFGSRSENPTDIIYNKAGIYDVTLTVYKEKDSSSTTIKNYILVDTTLNISIIKNDKDIKIFTSGKNLFLDRQSLNNKAISLQIFNASGSLIKSFYIPAKTSTFSYNFNSLPQGIYFILLNTDDKLIKQKIIF